MKHSLVSATPIGAALLVGTDEILLYTRRVILEKQGFVATIATPQEAAHHLKTSDFDLVVACHTLATSEADAVVLAAHTRSHAPALIGFTKQMSPEPTAHPFDGTVWSLASPEVFVGKVHEVLSLRQH